MIEYDTSMEQHPSWEANSLSVVKKPKVPYGVHKSPPLFPNLKQINPVQTFQMISVRSILILSSQ
jgi:hypothetical protein